MNLGLFGIEPDELFSDGRTTKFVHSMEDLLSNGHRRERAIRELGWKFMFDRFGREGCFRISPRMFNTKARQWVTLTFDEAKLLAYSLVDEGMRYELGRVIHRTSAEDQLRLGAA